MQVRTGSVPVDVCSAGVVARISAGMLVSIEPSGQIAAFIRDEDEAELANQLFP